MIRRATLVFACIVAMLSWVSAEAADVSLPQAKRAAGRWLERNPQPLDADIGGTPVAGKTHTRPDGTPLFHVMRLSEGGFIVTSADDGIDPIIAISDGETLVEDDGNPLWILLKTDMDNRRKSLDLERAQRAANPLMTLADLVEEGVSPEAQWADLLAESDFSILGLSSVADVRVSPLVQSTWDQDTVPGSSMYTYNYYTPNHYVCGCVATAMAQLMRYHQFPTANMSTFTRTCYVNDVATSRTTLAGTYSWVDMPLAPTSSISEAQRRAIGRLTYDAGVSVGMQYTADSSGAYTLECASALTGVFKYSNGMAYYPTAFNANIVQRAVLANLDGGCPVLLGISGDGGHAIVGDGYGYSSSKLYVHLNMGWSGEQNAWYNLPTVDTDYYDFDTLSTLVYNVYKSGTGELVTGRVLNGAGVGVAGVTVAAYKAQGGTFVTNTVTGSNGIYALRLAGSNNPLNIVATYNGATQTKSVTAYQSVSATYTRSGMGMSISNSGTVGNSWGNDFTFNLPAVPANVSATDGTSTDNVTVTWSAVSNATSYEVWRGIPSSSASATKIASGITGTTYPDVTANPGQKYYYWVKAVNASGTSAFSSSSSSNDGYRALLAPTGVSATDGTSTTGVGVTWNAVPNATFYCVYRATTPEGTKTALMSTWQAGLSYNDTSAVVGTPYYYFVKAGRSTAGTYASAYSAYDAGMRAEVLETSTTPVPVPYAWLEAFNLVSGSDYEAAAFSDSDGDGFDAWEEYVAGTVPTNRDSFFMSEIVVVNGTPVIKWIPDLEAARTYTVFGKTNLGDSAWFTPTNSATRFFRVGIDMN